MAIAAASLSGMTTAGRPPRRPRACGLQAGVGALVDQLPFELGEGGEDVEGEPA